MSLTRVAFALAVLGAAFALTACEATVNWGPLTSTYKGKVRVIATGTSSKTNSGGQNIIHLRDPIDDGNPVYAHTDWYVYGPPPTCSDEQSSSCGSAWYDYRTSITPEIQLKNGKGGTGTYTHSLSTLPRDGSDLRIISLACAQMGWPVPDSCTDDAIVTYSY